MKKFETLCYAVLLFSAFVAISSCAKQEDSKASDNSTSSVINDTTAPTVSSVKPADNATSVAANTEISVTFSEAMDATSVTSNTANSGCSGSLQVSSDHFSSCVPMKSEPEADSTRQIFNLIPEDNLSSETTYRIKVTITANDKASNALASEYTQSSGFTIKDWISPTLLSTSPADNASGVDNSTNISLTFSEDMDHASVTVNTDNTTCTGSVRLSSDNFSTCVRFNDNKSSADNITFSFDPYDNLSAGTSYKIKATNSARDEDNNSMSSEYTSATGFRTVAANVITNLDLPDAGFFEVTENTVSFLVHASSTNNSIPQFSSLKTPAGTEQISRLGDFAWQSKNYSNILVPISSDFQVLEGNWYYSVSSASNLTLTMRAGVVSTTPSITVQPYITGTTYNAENISSALSIMKNTYSENGVLLSIQPTESITDSKFARVSNDFSNSVTSELVSRGSADRVNLFFISGYTDALDLGNSAGIPGSQGLKGSHNGVLISLEAHVTGGQLDLQLLGETAGHEMGHFLGLFHPTEQYGLLFDPIDDTPECAKNTYDTNGSGKVSADECEQNGGNNLMFWTSYSSLSRIAGKKQDNLTAGQVYVLKRAPIAL